MTNHYNLHLVNAKVDFKITYRDGKFRKLEHLRGAINQEIVNALGRAVPREESNIGTFEKGFSGKIVYTNLSNVKVASIYSQFSGSWFAFFKKENNIEPKFTGVDGKSLKQIIAYLKKINNGGEAAALANWNLLLDNWSSLSDFHQAQIDLKYINSKLNVIIREIIRNNGGNTSGANGSVSL